jgi:GMP synthase (glutamine-hydrolysing)
MTRKVLVLYHAEREKAETFETIFKERGWDVQNIFVPAEDITALDPLAPDLVLVMGGPMGVYEQDKYPYLAHEIEFIKTRMASDLPTLGICLGSQLIACAMGQKIFKGRRGKEIGWASLELSGAGENHSVRHLHGAQTQMFHWHGDTYQIPEKGTLLASSAAYKSQAFTAGRTLALQFHPEVSAGQLDKWLEEDMAELQESILCKNIEIVRAQTEKNVKILNRQARLMMDEWLSSVGLD